MSAAGLEIDATVGRGGFRATVSLTVGSRGAWALLGPNGAGKSTVLRAIAGLDPVVDGEIRIGGVTVENRAGGVRLPTGRRQVGYVFQDYRLFPHLDVRDNVAFGLRTAGLSRRQARARSDELLRQAGIDHLAAMRPADLSGGESQRVAVARALAPAPRLLLLDEPLAALDVANRATVRDRLVRLVTETGVAVLMVTHDPGDALALGNRLAVIEDGRIVQRGSGQELAIAPASAWVARLVGRTGLAGRAEAGQTVEPGGTATVETAAGSLAGQVSGRLAGDPLPAGPVFASFSPAAVRLDQPGGGRSRNRWPQATVVAVERGLASSTLEVDLPGKARIRATVSPERAETIGRGDPVSVEIPPDTVRIASSGTPAGSLPK